MISENPQLEPRIARLAGKLYASLYDAYVNRSSAMTPSREDLDRAVDLACAKFKAIRFVLPKRTEQR